MNGRYRVCLVACASILVLGGCGTSERSADTNSTQATQEAPEHRETNPVARAQEILAQEYMSNHITEAQYHQGLKEVQQEGEAAVCEKDAKAFPQNCNPDGSVRK